MRFAELEEVCRDAARRLVEREGRPLPPAVVLPLPQAVRVTTFPEFPDDDGARFDLLARFAADVLRPANAPAFGFVAEGSTQQPVTDVIVVVCGARNHRMRVLAAPVQDAVVGEFAPSEELDATAMPFLSPLQHAVEAASPPDPLHPS